MGRHFHKFAFVQADRPPNQGYSWFVRVNDQTGRQILTHQSITHDGSKIGQWIFDQFPEKSVPPIP